MRICLTTAVCSLLLAVQPLAAKPFSAAFPLAYSDIDPALKAGIDAMDLRDGRVFLGDGIAVLSIPDGYYYLGPKDAHFVLEDLWGNPPGADTLGMIFPATTSPLDGGGWAAVVDFDPIGYVSDADAEGYDYDALLADMQSQVRTESEDRKKNGQQGFSLVGWATKPHYDKDTRKLHWAKLLEFEGTEGQTLNYNIRALGRKGVLIINFVADARDLSQVEAATPDVLKMVNFTDGNRYADYVPETDTLAAVGIGGLIAGKVAAKAGLLVVALAFLKKGVVLLLLPVLWLKKRIFGGGTPKA